LLERKKNPVEGVLHNKEGGPKKESKKPTTQKQCKPVRRKPGTICLFERKPRNEVFHQVSVRTAAEKNQESKAKERKLYFQYLSAINRGLELNIHYIGKSKKTTETPVRGKGNEWKTGNVHSRRKKLSHMRKKK